MRRFFVSAGIVLGVGALLIGLFWAIIHLQGPVKPSSPAAVETSQSQPPTPTSTPEAVMSVQKIPEVRNVEVQFTAGQQLVTFSSVPLVILEKDAQSNAAKVRPNLEVLNTIIASLPELPAPVQVTAAQADRDAKGALRRIKRGQALLELDREKARDALLKAVQKDPDAPSYAVTVPVREAEDRQSFEALRRENGFQVCLSTTETLHAGHMNDAGRNENLRIAAEKVDGTILRPGEEFSFNRLVGERSRKNGFQMAGVISNGKVIPGLGGGICQVSTALFGCSLKANLKTVERYNHSIYEGIPYAARGLDAAVVWGAKDFRFINTLPVPILISCRADKGYVQASFYAEHKPFDQVEVLTRNEKTLPFSVKQVKKAGAADRKIVRPGVTGFTIETYRMVTIGSKTVEERLHNDHYRMFPQVEEVSN